MVRRAIMVLGLSFLSTRAFMNKGGVMMRRTVEKHAGMLKRYSSTTTSTSGIENRIRIKRIIEGDISVGEEVIVKGWAKTVRLQKSLGFLEIHDGSSFSGLQCVFDDEDLLKELKKASTGCAVSVIGNIEESPKKGQALEVKAREFEIIGDCSKEYPLQKKRHSLEFLRSIAHLRPRTNTIGAVSRIRSTLAQATHAFFHDEGFKYVHSPIVTASDCEGAGEMFRVTSLSGESLEKASKTNDFGSDFFARSAYLTVSGQLSAEAYACALGDVYTFGPTFRAENSQTSRHLAEFWMIEPELAFADAQSARLNAQNLLKASVAAVLRENADDLAFCDKFYGNNELITRLERLADPSIDFLQIPYADAVSLLQKEIAKDPSLWKFPEVEFGTDLATEHERWLAEVYSDNNCVFVYDYPRSIKSFYMRDNDDDLHTVAAFDLLCPGVGELIGGSQREERFDKLEAKMIEFGLDPEEYWWYLDLRRYGSVPHAGYGVGFDRLVAYVTAQDNIRDVIPFPRAPGSADF